MPAKEIWPAWCNGPNGESQVFNSADEVPKGWTMPEGAKDAPASSAKDPPAPLIVDGDLDANGHLWSAELHATSKSRTKAGLWRMKVGMNRPEPAPGYPKPLDL